MDAQSWMDFTMNYCKLQNIEMNFYPQMCLYNAFETLGHNT
jgi:acyl carrier protein phosphodiesterase